MPKRRQPASTDAEGDARVALERSVSGALRSAIHDHGPITPAAIGSATKRVVGNLKNAAQPTSAAAAALGQLGGKAGRGKAKRRSRAHYKSMAASRWAGMTAEERSEEMRRRRRKGQLKKVSGQGAA